MASLFRRRRNGGQGAESREARVTKRDHLSARIALDALTNGVAKSPIDAIQIGPRQIRGTVVSTLYLYIKLKAVPLE